MHRLGLFRIGDEIGRDKPPLELHAFDASSTCLVSLADLSWKGSDPRGLNSRDCQAIFDRNNARRGPGCSFRHAAFVPSPNFAFQRDLAARHRHSDPIGFQLCIALERVLDAMFDADCVAAAPAAKLAICLPFAVVY